MANSIKTQPAEAPGPSPGAPALGPGPVLVAASAAVGVEFDYVRKTFATAAGPVQALDRIALTVANDAFVALIGPSGCGKSTLIRMAAALEVPDGGAVTVGGQAPEAVVAQQRVGFAMQDHALMPWLTVRNNVALPFRVAGRTVDWATVDHFVELVGLTQFAGNRPRELSGGMRQRASIARSLVLEPDLLLLDEPFGALDAVTRRRLNFELQNLWTERRLTTLMVTHSVEEAVLLADRVVVLSRRPGRVRLALDIPMPRPRDTATTRLPEFRALVETLTDALDEEAQP